MAYWESYEDFTEKFKHKMTTDDCYTPEPVYEAVKRWAAREYGIDESGIVRPFYPGGDYEHNSEYRSGGNRFSNQGQIRKRSNGKYEFCKQYGIRACEKCAGATQ